MAKTTTGMVVEMDAQPTPEGNMTMVAIGRIPLVSPASNAERKVGAPLYRAHFATCPLIGRNARR